jgi:hypothetical protein
MPRRLHQPIHSSKPRSGDGAGLALLQLVGAEAIELRRALEPRLGAPVAIISMQTLAHGAAGDGWATAFGRAMASATARSRMRAFAGGAWRMRKVPSSTLAVATISKQSSTRKSRISISRIQTMASVGVFTRPIPMTPLTPGEQRPRCCPDERQIEDLVGLLARATAAS